MLTESYQIRHYTGHQFQSTDKTCLSLCIAPHTFMYSVSVAGCNEVQELGHMDFSQGAVMTAEDKLDFFVRNFLLHKRTFEKVMVSILNTDFTLLPLAFGSEINAKEYLNFSSGDTSGKHVFSHLVGDFRFCYAIDSDLRQMLEKSFNAVFIRHAGAVNLSLFFNHRSFNNTPVALFVCENFIEVALKKNEKLLYYNVFGWSSNEDILYFLLSAMEQFGFDPAVTPIALAGEMPLDSELSRMLRKYIKQVQPVVTIEPVKLSKNLSELPGHYYFTLLNQHTCEL